MVNFWFWLQSIIRVSDSQSVWTQKIMQLRSSKLLSLIIVQVRVICPAYIFKTQSHSTSTLIQRFISAVSFDLESFHSRCRLSEAIVSVCSYQLLLPIRESWLPFCSCWLRPSLEGMEQGPTTFASDLAACFAGDPGTRAAGEGQAMCPWCSPHVHVNSTRSLNQIGRPLIITAGVQTALSVRSRRLNCRCIRSLSSARMHGPVWFMEATCW